MNRSAQLLPFPDMKKEEGKDNRALEVAFEEFWKCYPRKVGKPLARAKFMAIVKGGFRTRTLDRDSQTFMDIELDASPEEIIAGTKRYALSLIDRNTFKRKVEDKFIPHAATFLNQGRWMDE